MGPTDQVGAFGTPHRRSHLRLESRDWNGNIVVNETSVHKVGSRLSPFERVRRPAKFTTEHQHLYKRIDSLELGTLDSLSRKLRVSFSDMRRRSRPLALLLTLLFAVGQLLLPSALSIGDALSASAGRLSAAHVEAKSRPDCRAAHSDDCAVCRHLTAPANPSGAVRVMLPPVCEVEHIASAVYAAPLRSRNGFLSRAPPSGS